MDEATEIPSRRRIDGVTVAMIIVTVASLLGAAWLRTRRLPENEPPTVGRLAPPLRLLDLATSEPIVLVGLRGKVIWLVFWSADSPAGRTSLPALEPAWSSLKAQRRFAMVAAAIETDHHDRVRAAVAESGVTLPVYLASPETRKRFGVPEGGLPLHILIDAEGHIATLAHGASPPTIDRIAGQARRMLDELGPVEDARFARAIARPFRAGQTAGRPGQSKINTSRSAGSGRHSGRNHCSRHQTNASLVLAVTSFGPLHFGSL